MSFDELLALGDDFGDVVGAFAVDTGEAQTGKVGRAAAELVAQRPLVDYAADWFTRQRDGSRPPS